MSLETAQADIQLKAGQPLDMMMLRLAVADAGFIPTWIRFEASGMLAPTADGIALKVTGTNQVIPVKSDGTLEKLRQAAAQEGIPVVLVGLIRPGEETAQIEQFTVP